MKKLISVILAAAMIAAIAVGIGTYAAAYVNGDVNGDGEVNNKDVVFLFRYVSDGKKAEDESAYDFDGDGQVNNKDVIALFKKLVGEGKADPAEYEILLYSTGEGGAGSSNGQTGGKNFFGLAQESKKDDMEGKTIQMFEKVYTLKYTRTMDYTLYDEKYDRYYGNGAAFMYGEKSGRLVSYTNYEDEPAEGFTPPVNAHSTCEDFINYAKALLLLYFDTSTDDCDVEIKTVKLKTAYKYTAEDLENGFINFIDYDPNFKAEYHILFYKQFNGVNRIDDIEVDITSDGEVLLIKSRTCDEKFEKFKDVQFDAEGLKAQIENLSYDPSYLSYKILIRAIPDGDELWAIADVNYKYEYNGDIFGNTIQYIAKVVG